MVAPLKGSEGCSRAPLENNCRKPQNSEAPSVCRWVNWSGSWGPAPSQTLRAQSPAYKEGCKGTRYEGDAQQGRSMRGLPPLVCSLDPGLSSPAHARGPAKSCQPTPGLVLRLAPSCHSSACAHDSVCVLQCLLHMPGPQRVVCSYACAA